MPSGYAFSIWGLIYVYLLAHSGYGLLRRDTDDSWDKVRWPLIASLTIGASWIPVAKISPVWATVLILIMLVTALIAAFRSLEAKDRWLLQVPLAIYAGWLTAASFVSVGLLGAGYGVFLGQVGWAWIALISVLIVALIVQWKFVGAPEYGLTLIWALVAIAVRNWSDQVSLALLALGGALAVGFFAVRSAPAKLD